MPSFLDKLLGRGRADDPAPDERAGDDVAVLIDRGNALEDAGDAEGARALYVQAAGRAPGNARAHLNLGNALCTLRLFADAQESYRRVLALDPGHFGAYLNLGNALLADGRAAEAVPAYREAVRLRPDSTDARTGLGCALEESGALDDAVEAYRGALARDPSFAGALVNLASVLVQLRRGDEASELLEAALRREPGNTAVRERLAFLYRDWGESEAAVSALREVCDGSPDDLAVHSNLLFALQFLPRSDRAAVAAEHRLFGERLGARVERLPLSNAPLPERRLRIGFVSPDLRQHPVAVFLEPVLRHLDRGTFETFCYYTHDQHDGITRRLAGLSDAWREAAVLDDASLARQVQSDGIDILLDLAGHSARQRLGVFARKPAPVQFVWLGYLSTTGLGAIDYRLCDRHTDPIDDAEDWQVETPVRMPDSQWCYSPLFEVPQPGPLPRLHNGYWTFGSTNQAAKLNRGCLAAWARVLNTVRDSRLRLICIDDPRVERRLFQEFGRHGIAKERIETTGRLTQPAYFANYRALDILLDPLPCNGGTTTCDSLIMGVPVATVAGDRPVSRSGVSLLGTAGLEDWIARDEDALCALLLSKTADVEAMAALRAELPARLRASALMDGPRYARNFATTLRDAWRRWCAQR